MVSSWRNHPKQDWLKILHQGFFDRNLDLVEWCLFHFSTPSAPSNICFLWNFALLRNWTSLCSPDPCLKMMFCHLKLWLGALHYCLFFGSELSEGIPWMHPTRAARGRSPHERNNLCLFVPCLCLHSFLSLDFNPLPFYFLALLPDFPSPHIAQQQLPSHAASQQ